MNLTVAIAVAAGLALGFYLYARLRPVRVTIRAGRHRPGPWTRLLCALKIGWFGTRRIRVTFDGSCARYPDGNEDAVVVAGAWNKACGRTEGILPTSRSASTRLWWTRNRAGNAIHYTPVAERDGTVRNPWESGEYRTVAPGAPVVYRLEGRGWPCTPRFGGTKPAPEDVRLTLR